MKIAIWYRGFSVGSEPKVIKVGMMERELPVGPSLALRNHSPTGFNWGYGGSGPAQLALALLQDRFGDKYAIEHYGRFKEVCVSQMPLEWDLTEEELDWFKEGREMGPYFREKWPAPPAAHTND